MSLLKTISHPASRLALVLMMLACCLISWAAESGIEPSVLLGERPTVNGEPTSVKLGVFVLDIDEIDDVGQRFSIDMFFGVRWQDKRLALPKAERKGMTRFMALDEVWTPRLLILNKRGLSLQLPEGVDVDDFGNVTLRNRMIGELAANLEFRDFPFDTQRLPIEIVSYTHSVDELTIDPDTSFVLQSDNLSIEGWQLRQLKPDIGVFVVPTSGEEVPRVSFVLEARRDSEYYVLTLLVPMSLIIFMAWMVFWLQPSMVPPRIAISTASIFSLIALGVSIRLSLPKISYLTKADVFVLGCTLMIFLALGVAVTGSRWANSERMHLALKANAIARWLYVLLFVAVAAASLTL